MGDVVRRRRHAPRSVRRAVAPSVGLTMIAAAAAAPRTRPPQARARLPASSRRPPRLASGSRGARVATPEAAGHAAPRRLDELLHQRAPGPRGVMRLAHHRESPRHRARSTSSAGARARAALGLLLGRDLRIAADALRRLSRLHDRAARSRSAVVSHLGHQAGADVGQVRGVALELRAQRLGLALGVGRRLRAPRGSWPSGRVKNVRTGPRIA